MTTPLKSLRPLRWALYFNCNDPGKVETVEISAGWHGVKLFGPPLAFAWLEDERFRLGELVFSRAGRSFSGCWVSKDTVRQVAGVLKEAGFQYESGSEKFCRWFDKLPPSQMAMAVSELKQEKNGAGSL
jgi:hypothetical protein